jgi:hypothetical protein
MRLPSIVAFAFLALSAPIPSLTGAASAMGRPPSICGSDSYINSQGHCVRRPVRADRPPAGATAKCRDRTYSFSENHRGTCSHHGGVAQWL